MNPPRFAARRALVTCCAALMVSGAAAQSAAPAALDDALYQAFGGPSGMTSLVDDFVDHLTADPRVGPTFRDADIPALKNSLNTQFCQLTGGPCEYKGKDMKAAHSGVDVRKRDFNAVVEVLQDVMTAHGVAFPTQNRLLALLAPMHREIVNVR